VLATRVKSAHKLRGQSSSSPTFASTKWARAPTCSSARRPGTDLVWLSAISRYLLDAGLAKTEFLNAKVNGLENTERSLSPSRWNQRKRSADFPSRH